MKKTNLSLLLAGLALVLAPLVSPGQTPNPPGQISYQGFLTDANGIPLATNTPQNYLVTFRIYAASSGGAAKWGELQTVTVDRGYFTVMLGAGAPTGGAEPWTNNLASIFSGSDASDRYLGMTAQISGPGDPEIAPRLRLLASPYAFLAANALNAVNASNASNAVNAVNAVNLVNAAGNPLITASGNKVTISGTNVTINGTLSAATLTGNLADSNLTANVALLNRPVQVFTGAANSFSGQVGIGTTTMATPPGPGNLLTVNGRITSGGPSTGGIWVDGGSHQFVGSEDASHIGFYNDGWGMVMDNNGDVGIGTKTPTQAKLVVSGSVNTAQGSHSYLVATGVGGPAGPNTIATSIYASDAVMANSFQAQSDQRIKRIEGRSDAARDLETVQGIEVTDYSYIDTVAKSTGKQKKVIAQQVEKVFPQAVSKHTDVVPDIYQNATIKDGWVKLATNLKKGERVRLIGEKMEGIHEVLEVNAGKFRTDFAPDGDQVFVYGREVNDFRTVDYEAISMLNVSATQELARKLAVQDAEFTKLRAEVAQLRTEKGALAEKLAAVEARDQAREARLVRLELALQETPAGAKTKAQARGPTPAPTQPLISLNQ